jgi:hypothetical protein
MIKNRGGNQIEILIPNHKPCENKGQMSSDWDMIYKFGKIFSRAIIYCPHIFKIGLI